MNGPSLLDHDLTILNFPGFLTFGVNNGPKVVRPNLWCSVDHPGKFLRSIWMDPLITKFVPICNAEKNLYDHKTMKPINVLVGDCPNVMFFRRNGRFCPESFLYEDKINWGNCKENGGGRSVMLASLRILFYLGIRNVFLLGCDFDMKLGKQNYCFDQDRKESSVKSNRKTYERNIERFEQLLPFFEKEGFQVFNCNPKSNLKVFPFVKYEDAVLAASSHIPNLSEEKTEGLYEFKYDTPKMSDGTPTKDYEKREKRRQKKEEREQRKREREKRNADRKSKSRTKVDNSRSRKVD
jgi:hypothetical protein